MDSVVLLGGDKTVPAQLMGAVSADLPAIQLVAGPMSTSRYQGERLGASTDCRRYWAKYRAGEILESDIDRIEDRLASTAGTCGVIGTASTMASVVEALGMMPAARPLFLRSTPIGFASLRKPIKSRWSSSTRTAAEAGLSRNRR